MNNDKKISELRACRVINEMVILLYSLERLKKQRRQCGCYLFIFFFSVPETFSGGLYNIYNIECTKVLGFR